jgi:inner membrane transporter RhtA
VVGAVLLQQVPHGLEVVGLLLVSGAIVLTGLDRDDAPTDEAPPPA